MNMSFDKSKIYQMLNDFYTVTGLSFGIYNKDNEVEYCNSTFPEYCSEIRKNPGRKEQCNVAKYRAAIDAAKEKKAVTYCCHAGLCETVIPIYYGILHIGYFVIGQYIDSENIYATEENFESCCRQYNLDMDSMRDKREKLKVTSAAQLEAIIRFASIVIEYIISHKMIIPMENDIEAALVDYIDKHYAENIRVEDLCRLFYISRSELYKIFRNLGTSPHNYINNIRMEKAREMLLESDKTISEISDRTGFADYNYFIHSFKKKYGITPKKYKAERLNRAPLRD